MRQLSNFHLIAVDNTEFINFRRRQFKAWKNNKVTAPLLSFFYQQFPQESKSSNSGDSKAYGNCWKNSILKPSQIGFEEVVDHPSHNENWCPETYNYRASNSRRVTLADSLPNLTRNSMSSSVIENALIRKYWTMKTLIAPIPWRNIHSLAVDGWRQR